MAEARAALAEAVIADIRGRVTREGSGTLTSNEEYWARWCRGWLLAELDRLQASLP